MKFREHRRELLESMETTVEFQTEAELRAYLNKIRPHIPYGNIQIKPYGRDERIGWDVHIVIAKDYGVVGYTDGPVNG